MNRTEPWTGDHMDLYAADLAALVADLDLRDAIRVGHSTGGGAVLRHVGRHGTSHADLPAFSKAA
jgi:non-heme chloroperoxidase